MKLTVILKVIGALWIIPTKLVKRLEDFHKRIKGDHPDNNISKISQFTKEIHCPPNSCEKISINTGFKNSQIIIIMIIWSLKTNLSYLKTF